MFNYVKMLHLFHLACLRHLIGLIKAEQPIARQEDRGCWRAKRINRRRKEKREQGEGKGHAQARQAACRQTGEAVNVRYTEEERSKALRQKVDKEKTG